MKDEAEYHVGACHGWTKWWLENIKAVLLGKGRCCAILTDAIGQ